MRKLCLGFLLLLLASTGMGQSASVKGKVVDTLEKKDLRFAVVTLLNTSDSTIFNFHRTDSHGLFQFDQVPQGKYVLFVSYPKFADYADEITVPASGLLDLKTVPLTLKSQLLDAVVIKSAGAVRIKGDTTEFVADSFKVRDGATVEELLKKLPGFQVNSKGEITAQGQRVQKVLVDGEEFFGDDPTMATQNISAKAVDKVQVFDNKTDQQNLTGMTTGNKGKTVNIKLKEDAKKGAFGKAHVGSDFNKLFDAKAMYNQFHGSRKVSLYGTRSDLTTGSLNWEDKQKLGIEEDYEYDEVTGYYFSAGDNDEFNNWSLRGLPHSYTAGALYSNKMRAEKDKINLSYRFNRLATDNDASTLTQNILASGTTYRNKFQHSEGLNQQHAGNFKYEWKLDSLATLKLTTAMTYKTTRLKSNVYSEFLASDRSYVNQSDQLIDNATKRVQSDNQLQYKQLFRKKDRQLIATLRLGTIEDNMDGTIISNTRFYEGGTVDSTELADQQKTIRGNSKTIGGKVTWSEPLSMKWTLVAEYSLNKNSSGSRRDTYNRDASGKYTVSDADFSNHFDLDVNAQSGTGILKYNTKAIRAAFGSGISNVKLKLYNIDKDRRSNYNFLNITPQGTIAWMYKPQSRIFLNYRGNTKPPTIDQLQPIRDNADRLNIFVGNPDLKVGFVHSIGGGFNTYKVLSQRGVFSNFQYQIPVNAITFYNTLDVTKGTQVYTPVNVNGNRNWNAWVGIFKDAGEKKISFSPNMNANGGRNVNFINGARNVTKYFNSDVYLYFRYNHAEKKSFEIGPKFGYNSTVSSLNPAFKNNYWDYGGRAEGFILLPGKFELNSDINVDLRQHLAAFPSNPNQIIWNASLAKKVFKKNTGKIFLMANDILDQNRGFNRNISSNFVSEERYSKLSRYFLLKFEYTFNKMPGQTK